MRKNILLIPTLALSILVMLSSCEKSTGTVDEERIGHDYQPLATGKYILYDVDSIYWDDFLRAEIHVQSQQRYDVVDSFIDNEGRVSWTINVLSRQSEDFPFTPDHVIHVTPTNNFIEFSQKNLTFLNMTFPVQEGVSWNGLAKIATEDPALPEFNSDGWKFTFANVGLPFNTGNNYFAKTATVNQIDEQLNDPETDSMAFAFKNYSQEIFGYDVGMIYKERIYWVFQPSPGGSGYRKGYGVIMRAIEHN